MFTKYFLERTGFLQNALSKRLEKKGLEPLEKKDLKVFKEFYDFIKEHIPVGYSLAIGKIRNRTHVLNKKCDLIIYKKWCKNFLKLTDGYILTDQIYSFLSLENELTTDALLRHIDITRSVKTMYAMDYELSEDKIVPLYSVMFAYKSRVPLLSHKLSIVHAGEEKGIPVTHEVDMVCVLDQGIIIKDWEQGGSYKIIETQEDTLMWFYILLIEFLDRDNELKLDLRSYIKGKKEYAEK